MRLKNNKRARDADCAKEKGEEVEERSDGGEARTEEGDRERKREERHFSLAFPVNDSPAIAGIPSTATITSRKRSLSRMVTLVEIEI